MIEQLVNASSGQVRHVDDEHVNLIAMLATDILTSNHESQRCYFCR